MNSVRTKVRDFRRLIRSISEKYCHAYCISTVTRIVRVSWSRLCLIYIILIDMLESISLIFQHLKEGKKEMHNLLYFNGRRIQN